MMEENLAEKMGWRKIEEFRSSFAWVGMKLPFDMLKASTLDLVELRPSIFRTSVPHRLVQLSLCHPLEPHLSR